MNAIEIKNLTKQFNKKIVLDNINLDIESNQIFGFLGKNGAGKSTLINVLSGNIHKTDGIFKIFDYSDYNINDIKKTIGVMPDVSNLYNNMTGVEFLMYMSGLKDRRSKIDKNDINKILNMVNLDGANKVQIKNYSFGMKKKISLAQAIIGKPKLIFLDEPTSGVDPESILAIHEVIKNLEIDGSTIFLTSHNLNEIEKLCSNIAILEQGRIKINGNIEKLKEDFSKNIVINIDFNCNSNLEEIINFKEFDSLKLIKTLDNKATFELDNKSSIPKLVKVLVDNNIMIYSLYQESIGLEEIFLN